MACKHSHPGWKPDYGHDLDCPDADPEQVRRTRELLAWMHDPEVQRIGKTIGARPVLDPMQVAMLEGRPISIAFLGALAAKADRTLNLTISMRDGTPTVVVDPANGMFYEAARQAVPALIADVTLLRGMVAALVFEASPSEPGNPSVLRCRMCGKTCVPEAVDAPIVSERVAHNPGCEASFVLPKGWPRED